MIIIEGSDQLGKTTLARKLSIQLSSVLYGDEDHTERVYRHMTRPPDGFDHLTGYVERVGPHVWDRFHLGALAYGRLTGNGGCPNPRQMLWVQRYLRWQGAIVIVMHADRWWLKEHLDSTREEMYSKQTILDVNDIFVMISRSSNHGEKYCDFSIDVTDGAWPNEQTVEMLVNTWRERWLT